MNKIAFLHTSINVIKRKIFKVSPGANNHLKVNSTLKYTEWTGKIDHDWHDAANWSNGLPFRYLHAFIPRVPKGNHFPQITEACKIDFTIKNQGILSNQSKAEITLHGLLQNHGILKIEKHGELNNHGKLINHGTLRNAGHLNSQHIFCNLKTIENTGTITNESRILQLSTLLKSETNPLSVFDFIKKQKLASTRK